MTAFLEAQELFGKGMYEQRTRGKCTTSANHLTTLLGAIDLPTRGMITLPLVDSSDPRNIDFATMRLWPSSPEPVCSPHREFRPFEEQG